MQCPFCNCDNIDGVDACIRCKVDLSDFTGSEAESDIERALLKNHLESISTKDYIEAPMDWTVGDTIRRWNEGGHHCAVVVDNGVVVGIFTERDALRKLAGQWDKLCHDDIGQHMTSNPVTLSCDDPIALALNHMMVGGYRHIPVMRNEKLCGIVSVRDILSYLALRFDDVLT